MDEFKIQKRFIDHLHEINATYQIVSNQEIELFEKIATKYDQDYIDELIRKCTNWLMKKDWDDIYHQKTERDEIKMLQRVKYRIEKHKLTEAK